MSLATEENVLQFQVSSTYSQKLIPRPVAILDLSERVFADGMAHVALSRVQGLHLTAFDSASIKVNTKCLKDQYIAAASREGSPTV